MKIFLFLLSFSLFNLNAKEEVETLYRRIQDVVVYDQMKEAGKNELNDCLAKNNIKDIKTATSDKELDQASNCFINKLSDNALESLAPKLGIKGANFTKTETSKKFRAYLSKRLREGLYGDALKENKDFKIISQETYLSIYENQVTNSIIFIVSEFCLKNYFNDDSSLSENEKILAAFKQIQSSQNLKEKFNLCRKDIEQKKCQSAKIEFGDKTKDSAMCALKLKLEGYQTVLSKVNESKVELAKFGKDPDRTIFDPGALGFEVQDFYSGKNSGEKKAFELANITSYDSYKAFTEDDPDFFEGNQKEFDEKCNSENSNDQKCSELVSKDEQENFNKLKFSILAEYNSKTKDYQAINSKEEILEKLEQQGVINNKKREELALLNLDQIKTQVSKIFDNYKVSIINELNERFKDRLIDSNDLSAQKNRLGNISKNIATQGEVLQKLLTFNNLIAAQYSVDEDGEEKSTSAYVFPTLAETADLEKMKSMLPEPDDYKWVWNYSKEFEEQSVDKNTGGFKMSESFFENLFD
jgi:hypothetical protein